MPLVHWMFRMRQIFNLENNVYTISIEWSLWLSVRISRYTLLHSVNCSFSLQMSDCMHSQSMSRWFRLFSGGKLNPLWAHHLPSLCGNRRDLRRRIRACPPRRGLCVFQKTLRQPEEAQVRLRARFQRLLPNVAQKHDERNGDQLSYGCQHPDWLYRRSGQQSFPFTQNSRTAGARPSGGLSIQASGSCDLQRGPQFTSSTLDQLW